MAKTLVIILSLLFIIGILWILLYAADGCL
jgi:hypothetical protein